MPKSRLDLSRGQNSLTLATSECSGCFGFKARRPKWRVASLRRRSAGCMPDKMARFAVDHSSGASGASLEGVCSSYPARPRKSS